MDKAITQRYTVCVFAGARGTLDLDVSEQAGAELAKRGWHVVFGGSAKGHMGALARGVFYGLGTLTGIIPTKIRDLGHHVQHESVEMVVTDDMAIRKSIMWKSDAYLCLPGAFGSMDELFEILTLMKLGYVRTCPVVVLNVNGFYDGLVLQLFKMAEQGMLGNARNDLVQVVTTVEDAMVALLGKNNATLVQEE